MSETSENQINLALDMAESLLCALESTQCPPQAFATLRRAVVLAVNSKLANGNPGASRLADAAAVAALDAYCEWQTRKTTDDILDVMHAIVHWQF
jgi:hypothetical protein